MDNRFELFTLLIAKCSRSIRKIKSVEMDEFDLKSPHVSCIYYLYRSPKPLTAAELCDICEEDKAQISRSIDSLEKDGFIERISKTEKPYKSPLLLTKKGKEVALNIAERIDKIVDLASAGLNDDNRKIFYQSLTLISDNLQKICDTYGEK